VGESVLVVWPGAGALAQALAVSSLRKAVTLLPVSISLERKTMRGWFSDIVFELDILSVNSHLLMCVTSDGML